VTARPAGTPPTDPYEVTGALHTVTVAHSFETAHRLPHLNGKCLSLHGHSWRCEITVAASGLAAGTVVQFGPLKQRLREWVDVHLDHGTMLGHGDPLVAPLRAEGRCKVYVFGSPDPDGGEDHAVDLDWPTVENVAYLLARVAERALAGLRHAPGAYVCRVQVTETARNTAAWTAL
jgi:6-pyruvoyltetrahydropterin/6-carboxytetrahydropterin synthase